MAPPEKKIIAALRGAVLSTFNGPDRSLLTVKKIREKVEGELDLGEDFFSQGQWKDKAKTIIRGYAVSLILFWPSTNIPLTYSSKN